MTERDEVPRTTPAERERAQAVHSLDDETRLSAGGDESELVQGAGGDVHQPQTEDRGGDPAGDLDDDEAGRG